MTTAEINMTVAELAEDLIVSTTTVRRWIARGALKVDRSKRPLRIISGYRPWRISEWRYAFNAWADQNLRPGTYGTRPDGTIEVLIGTEISEFGPGECQDQLDVICGSILMLVNERKAAA